MSVDRATIRARSIWGKLGLAWRRKGPTGIVSCHVGKVSNIGTYAFTTAEGDGDTFEAAFADYEAKQRRYRIGRRAVDTYAAVQTCREFVRAHTFDGATGEQAAALDNYLTTLIDEIEGGS